MASEVFSAREGNVRSLRNEMVRNALREVANGNAIDFQGAAALFNRRALNRRESSQSEEERYAEALARWRMANPNF